MICAGEAHSLVTSGKMGEIWSFGNGVFGKLGNGGEGDEVVPRLIEALNRVVVNQVAAGGEHSMALTREGDVFTWGLGGHGQLGHDNQRNQDVPKRVEGLTNVMDIAAGSMHSLSVGGGGGSVHVGRKPRRPVGAG